MQAAEGDDEQEYQRLLHFMTRPGPRFAMALARYRDATVARTLRDRLIVEAASRECRAVVLELSGADAAVDIIARLQAAIGHDDARLDVLFVVGLEALLIDSLGGLRHTPAISNLNQRRDRLPELLDARIIWWIGDWAYAAYATDLRDLSEVMRTSVQFSGRIESFVEPGRSAYWPGWMAHVQPEQRAVMAEQTERLERLHDRASEIVERAELASSVAQLWASLGEREPACTWFQRAAEEFEQAGMLERAAQQACRHAIALQFWGELDRAQAEVERALDLARRAGDAREELEALVVEADIATSRGQFDHALGLLRDVIIPAYERLGDVRSRAVTLGRVADILQARGELDEALRIRREEELPVYERLGDVRSQAVALGGVADILQARGELDEALRIRREEELPVFERLGDVRSRAMTLGKVAYILQARGELDEALRIRREEELPVFERLGDVRTLLVGRANLALNLVSRGRDEDIPESVALLAMSLRDARRLQIPEAAQIAGIARRLGLNPDVPPFV
jgi:tetratricopeptide (TPR) repeat protein